ncbi:MAG TPA: PGPGW domain-containing protein [Pyrinomonadaceae bacterium]|nr:PGPGW domain-containing protein [Pyrinomonadaceae bacterium]
MSWLSDIWMHLTLGRIIFGIAFFILSLVGSALVVGVVMVKIPYNYFSSHYQADFLPNSPWLTRWGAVVAKNIVGLILVLAGIVMLVGPGQGILTILIGLILMDIPGKRPIEARIIKRPVILAAANDLRARYNKPPLLMD